MRKSPQGNIKAGRALTMLALCGAALLSGCSSRDTVLAEQVSAANAAAARAELAAKRAEYFSNHTERAAAPAVVEADPAAAPSDGAASGAPPSDTPGAPTVDPTVHS